MKESEMDIIIRRSREIRAIVDLLHDVEKRPASIDIVDALIDAKHVLLAALEKNLLICGHSAHDEPVRGFEHPQFGGFRPFVASMMPPCPSSSTEALAPTCHESKEHNATKL